MVFRDRVDAGRRLGALVLERELADPLVLGLPRGGVPVAAQVADALNAPLDVVAVRKLGVPSHPELAFGAIAEHGARVLNDPVVAMYGLREADMAAVEQRERLEMQRRIDAYVGDAVRPAVLGKTAVLVDDGLATGATMRAAIEAVKTRRPARTVVAVPVASPRTMTLLERVVHEVIAVETPIDFMAVGAFYGDFRQTSDAEVKAILAGHRMG